MKHIKRFEDNNSVPKIGDYVICKVEGIHYGDNVINFIQSSIGEITHIFSDNRIIVKYANIPQQIKRFFYDGNNNDQLVFGINDIVKFGTKEELEFILTTNKYNL